MKVLEGAQPCRINRDEPKSPPGLGEPPDWFDDYSLEAWARLKERLGPMKVATRADEEAVVIYCQAYSSMRQALDEIRSTGMMVSSTTEITTKNGSMTREVHKANPMLPTVRLCQRQMMAVLTQLGMTPSSRSGLHVQEQPEEDALLSFIYGGKAGPRGKRRQEGH